MPQETPKEKEIARAMFAQVLEALDPDRLTKQEIEEFLKTITEHVKKTREMMEEDVVEMKAALQSAIAENKQNSLATFEEKSEELTEKMETMMNRMYAEHESMMAMCEAKMEMMQDGEDGKDADEEMIVKSVLASIKLPESPTLESIVEAVKESISLKDMPEWKELMERLSNMRTKSTLGASVIHKFIDDETPSGTKNGVNTTFYLAKAPIGGSLKLFRGGARQRVTEDYTLSGKTITFLVAPEAGEVLTADYRHL